MTQPQQVPQAVVDALLRGDKIGAVKLVREATGGDLKSAMAMVQSYLEQAGHAERGRQRSRTDDGHGEVSSRRGAELSDHLSKGMSQGRAEVHALMHATRTPTVMEGDGASKQWVWLLVVVVATAAWLFFG